jgi:hypothetical protein
MVSCFPCASRSSRLPFIVPSVAAACFRLLLCVKFSIGGRLWPRPSPSLYFFVACLHSSPQTMGQCPPHVPPRSRLLSNAPLTVDNNFSVGCCVPPSNGGHLRPRVRPSLFFVVDYFDPPNDRQPSSPHVPTQPRLFSNALSNVVTVSNLIVV